MVCKSFDEFPRNELIVARDNLAEVYRYGLDVGLGRSNPEQMWHVMGNFLLATAATADADSLKGNLESEVMSALVGTGEPEETAADLAEKLTDISVTRRVFPLYHIPDEAPELVLRPRSRELDVSRFAKEAGALRPGRSPDPSIEGKGNALFIGSYVRKLS